MVPDSKAKGGNEMTTIEQLKAIRARCVELLAIAEKRTPGRWWKDDPDCAGHVVMSDDGGVASGTVMGLDVVPVSHRIANAAFIAACAGAAEAGWLITIETIDWLIEIDALHLPICDSIIKAWEGQL